MSERERDDQSAARVRELNEQRFREAVRRQHRAGLSDWGIARALGRDWRTVKRAREALGLPANKGGEL